MSNNLNLSQVAAAQDQKEVTINDQAGELDAALTEQHVADVSAGNVALTAAEYRAAIHIKATGAATAGRTVTLQAIKRLVVISNASTTDSVDFVLGSTTITLAPAPSASELAAALVYTDGTANGLFSMSSGSVIISDVGGINFTSPTQGQMVRFDGSGDLVNEDTPFDIAAWLPGTYSAGATMLRIVFDRAATFADDFAGSRLDAGVAATASTVFDIQKNGATIGTITVGAAGTTGTFATSGGATSFAAGDVLAILNESPADATLADVSITLLGTRD